MINAFICVCLWLRADWGVLPVMSLNVLLHIFKCHVALRLDDNRFGSVF